MKHIYRALLCCALMISASIALFSCEKDGGSRPYSPDMITGAWRSADNIENEYYKPDFTFYENGSCTVGLAENSGTFVILSDNTLEITVDYNGSVVSYVIGELTDDTLVLDGQTYRRDADIAPTDQQT